MTSDKESRFLLVAAVFVFLFGVWFYTIKDAFPSFLISLILIGFLLPFREHRSIRILILLVGVILLIWLFYYLQEIIAPFLIAFALAYLFDPLADRLEKWKIARTPAILLITIAITGTIGLFGLLVLPQFIDEVRNLASRFPDYSAFQSGFSPDLANALRNLGLDADRIAALVESETAKKTDELLRYFSDHVLNVTAGLSSLVTQLINAILIPFLTFYFLRDFDTNIAYLKDRTPERHHARFDKVYDRVNSILSLYIRGKLLAALVISVVTWLALTILDIRFAVVVGLVTGVLSLVPYVGPLFTFVLGVLIGLLNPEPVSAAVTIVLVLAVIHLLDMVIISPKVVGEKLGLHPVLMIFSLFVFAKILGLTGLLLAIPVTAILKVFAEEWYERKFLSGENGAAKSTEF